MPGRIPFHRAQCTCHRARSATVCKPRASMRSLAPAELNYRQLAEDELPEVAAFNGRFLPRRADERLLSWEFYDPALPEKGVILGAFDGDRLVGTQAFIPFRAWYRGEELLSAKSELTLLDPEYRGRKVFQQLYDLGFSVCESLGIECIWGFTSAIKPFERVGFQIGEPLFTEDLLIKPVRAAAMARGILRARAPERLAADLPPLPDARDSEFGLRRDDAYLRHRYSNNPARGPVHLDSERGVLYSGGPAAPWVFVSEAVSADGVVASIRSLARPGRRHRWAAVRRVSFQPLLDWRVVPGAVHLVRESDSRTVWRWLGSRHGLPIPRMHAEEGFSEGTA
jgi:GNAT superfamily N-acetyltransferase